LTPVQFFDTGAMPTDIAMELHRVDDAESQAAPELYPVTPVHPSQARRATPEAVNEAGIAEPTPPSPAPDEGESTDGSGDGDRKQAGGDDLPF
jgi:hypothetical protein